MENSRNESENHSYRTAIAIGFAIAIASIVVILRLIARRVQKLSLGQDDYFIIAGLVLTISNAIVFIFSNKYGNGRHIDTIQPADLIKYRKASYASYQLYGLALTLIKVSILLFYRRVFATSQYRRWTNGVGTFVIIWLLAHNLTAAFQCSPLRKAWEDKSPGHCINTLKFVIGTHVANLILDVIILALPISAVIGLQMSRAKKLRVAGVFLLGGLSVAIATVRLFVLLNGSLEDETWLTSLSSWSLIEPALEIVSVSIPAMAPFLHVHAVIAYIRASLGSLVCSHEKSSQPDNGYLFNSNNKFNRHVPPVGQSQCIPSITADDISGSSLIGSDSIAATKDLDVVEESDLRWGEGKDRSVG